MNSSQHRDIARAATAAAYFLAGELYEQAIVTDDDEPLMWATYNQYVGALRSARQLERFCG